MNLRFPTFFYLIRYYDLDAYHRRMMEKEKKKGLKSVMDTERTVFNDEEQRRYVDIYIFLVYVYLQYESMGHHEWC